LQASLNQGVKRLLVKGDSELVIRHMQGSYAVRAHNLKHLYMHAKALERRFTKIEFTHIARSANAEADALANDAIGGYCDEVVSKYDYN